MLVVVDAQDDKSTDALSSCTIQHHDVQFEVFKELVVDGATGPSTSSRCSMASSLWSSTRPFDPERNQTVRALDIR